jgi:hypothetical protein
MSDTPRTDAKSFGSQVMAHEMVHADFARELERENDILMEDRDYFESSLRKAEDRELNLMKDKEMLDWLLSRAIVQYYPDADPEYLHRIESREDINKAISSGDC